MFKWTNCWGFNVFLNSLMCFVNSKLESEISIWGRIIFLWICYILHALLGVPWHVCCNCDTGYPNSRVGLINNSLIFIFSKYDFWARFCSKFKGKAKTILSTIELIHYTYTCAKGKFSIRFWELIIIGDW